MSQIKLPEIKLPVKYFNQVDNESQYHGSGSRQCNLTANAMAAEYLLTTRGLTNLTERAKKYGSGTATAQTKSAGLLPGVPELLQQMAQKFNGRSGRLILFQTENLSSVSHELAAFQQAPPLVGDQYNP